MKALLEKGCVITGTDTDVGKTVCAIHCLTLTQGTYWKPIQSGRPRDRERVQEKTGLDETHFIKERYDFTKPLSPHEAAAYDQQEIVLQELLLPKRIMHPPLIVEGAGGVFVPLNKREFMMDLFCQLSLPILLVARSTLGTINHTLLTIDCVRRRGLSLLGVVVVGPFMPANEEAISFYGKVPIVGRIDLSLPETQFIALE